MGFRLPISTTLNEPEERFGTEVWYAGGCWMGRYIWYSDEGTGRGRSPPRPLLAVAYQMKHPT